MPEVKSMLEKHMTVETKLLLFKHALSQKYIRKTYDGPILWKGLDKGHNITIKIPNTHLWVNF